MDSLWLHDQSGPEPRTSIAETSQLWVWLNKKNKQAQRARTEPPQQRQPNTRRSLAYLGQLVTQFSSLPEQDTLWRAWMVLSDQADGEAGGSSCHIAVAWKREAREHRRAGCRRQRRLRSLRHQRGVRVHADTFMTATEIPHEKASLVADLRLWSASLFSPPLQKLLTFKNYMLSCFAAALNSYD